MRTPIRRERHPILVFVIILASVLVLPTGARAGPATVTLHMVGEAPRFNGPTPILVAGIWHQITVNLTGFLNGASLTLATHLSGSANASPANTYRWVRNEANDTWSDALYGTFLRKDLSADIGTQITFGVGIDALATPGLWTLEAAVGNASVAALDVEVEAPHVGYGVSIADFTFRLDPFIPANLSSRDTGQFLSIANQGNVPLGMGVSFDLLRGALRLANPESVAHVGSGAIFFLDLNLGAMAPQIIHVYGTTDVRIAEAVPSSGASVLVPTLQRIFPVTVQVGRSGYGLKVVGNVAFQTIDVVSAISGSVTTWEVFLTGSQNVSLNVSATGAKLLAIIDGDRELALPATVVVEPNREHALAVRVEAERPGIATVVFTLRLLDTGDVRTFTTTLTVDAGPSPPVGPPSSFYALAGGVAIVVVLGFVALGDRGRVLVGGRKAGKRSLRPRGSPRLNANENRGEDREGEPRYAADPRDPDERSHG